MADCTRCGKPAGPFFSVCDSCSKVDWAEQVRLTNAEPQSSPESADAGRPQETTCPVCGGEVVSTARKCRHCGEWLIATANPGNAQLILTLGALLFVVGLCCMVYGFNLSAAVAVDNPVIGGREVNNLGLLDEKQNIITASGSLVVAGAVIFAAGFVRSGPR